jgi:hypothetical protein
MFTLVAHGLCNSQVVVMFFLDCVFMVASLVSYGGCYETIGSKKMVVMSFLCVTIRKYLLSKSLWLGLPCLWFFIVGLVSLLKWVISTLPLGFVNTPPIN